MFVLSLQVEVHVPNARSLKNKRSAVKPVIEGARRRFGVSAAEVDHQHKWQRASIGFAVVSSTHAKAQDIIDSVERFVWSFPEIVVMNADRIWLEAS
ncbi:MAG TPA: DUF503 domain-containing protein [Acidimicrobiales bacterium]|nr:DUF503 domain-containing protein [Acidimicrobiales bacterium]